MTVQAEIIKTNLSLVVRCKCGGVIAATMLYGGIDIDEGFMTTLAETHNEGGKIELRDADKEKVFLSGCKCENK